KRLSKRISASSLQSCCEAPRSWRRLPRPIPSTLRRLSPPSSTSCCSIGSRHRRMSRASTRTARPATAMSSRIARSTSTSPTAPAAPGSVSTTSIASWASPGPRAAGRRLQTSSRCSPIHNNRRLTGYDGRAKSTCDQRRDRPVAMLLVGGAVITVDAGRRVLDPGAVAVEADTIAAVGTPGELREQFPGAEEIDLRDAAILPGLVDRHGHAGHGLTKALGDGAGDWLDLVAEIYFRQSDTEFWRAEGFLSALEHIEYGVTTSLSMTGSAPRVDEPKYAIAASRGFAELGLRHIVALGPPNTPWPATYRDLETGREISVDLD